MIAVNAWMNNPSGFRVQGGKAVDVHPWSALFGNHYLWHEIVHMYVAAYIVVGFLVAGAYSVSWLRGDRSEYVRTALALPLTIAALAAPVQLVVGDWAARTIADDQPVKLAAFEGLAKTTKGAPEHILGWYSDGKVTGGIGIPDLLSLLATHDPDGTVQGLDTVPKDDQPPVNVVRFAFQTMVGIGTGLAALAAWFLVVRVRRGRPPASRWFYRGVIAAGPLSLVGAAGRLGDDRGRPPALGRLRGDAHRGGGDGRERDPDRLRDTGRRLRRADRGERLGAAADRPRAIRQEPAPREEGPRMPLRPRSPCSPWPRRRCC